MEFFIPELLFEIRRSSHRLLPRQDLRCLASFAAGFDTCLVRMGVATAAVAAPPREFSEWVGRKFQISGQLNSFSMVELRYGNEQVSFEKFFILLEEFLQNSSGENWTSEFQFHSSHSDKRIDHITVLQELYKRPSLFLGQKSLTQLFAFLAGCGHAEMVAKLDVREFASFDGIYSRIRSELGYSEKCDVRQILLLHNLYDESLAFEEFYKFLGE